MFNLIQISILLILLTSFPDKLISRTKIDYPFLRDIICDDIETPGEPYPDFSVGKVTKQRGGLPWGRCQVKYWTAVRNGFSISRNPGDLFNENTNREFSLKVLKSCKRGLIKRKLPETVRTVSHCYGSGYYKRHPRSAYSKDANRIYRRRFLQRKRDQRAQILQLSRINYLAAIKVAYKGFEFAREKEIPFKWIIRKIKLFIATHEIREVNYLWEI